MSRIPFRRLSSERGSRRRALASDGGQTLPEYTIVLAAIAVACVAAVVLLAAGIGGLFDSTDEPLPQSPFVPPGPQQLSYPANIAECKHGRWRNYAQFANEAECRKYVEDRTS